MSDLKTLYKNHIKLVIQSANKALSELNYHGLILGSGKEHFYFEDDMPAPFKTNPHFAHWCPAKGPNHFIKYIIGEKPKLIYFSPSDFWHIHEEFNDPFWADSFDVARAESAQKAWQMLGDTQKMVFLGEDTKYAIASEIKVNCAFLTARLNWYRRQKSAYEVHCIQKANQKASIAHKAAHNEFLNGGSEYDIHLAYLQAIEETDADLPYTGIVGLNKNAAILHYHRREKIKNGNVLLIDSGASYLHYSADITRTYCTDKCPKSFRELLASVESLQQELCSDVNVNAFFPDLHYKCHQLTLQALQNCGVVKSVQSGDFDRLVDEGFTKTFLPHGLGHMIGVQVHDIGGKQLDEQGNPAPKLEKQTVYQSLRYLGSLEENNVVTIEPGIYFIPMLLDKLKTHAEHSKLIDWKLVEELLPYGGIRIEDEVCPTATGAYNITREFLP